MRALAAASADQGTFVLEYRIVRSDGQVRWVLDRGQLVPGPGDRLWMDGALFDITDRRAAEEALRRQEIDRARTEELRASRIRIVEAADAARRRIERDLHDGAQQRLVKARRWTSGSPSATSRRTPRRRRPFLAPDRRGALRGVGRAARAGPRHPPRGADRPRARGRPSTRSSTARTVPGRGARDAGGAARAVARVDGLLHRRRGADQRRQVRARPATPPCGSPASTTSWWWRSPTTAWAAPTPPRLRAERPRRPRGRHRRAR